VLRQAMETRMANATSKLGSDALGGGNNRHPESEDVLPGGGGGDSLEDNAENDKLTGDGQLTDAPMTSGTSSLL
jgi:hypothetical protein